MSLYVGSGTAPGSKRTVTRLTANGLLEVLQTVGGELREEKGQPRDVAARSREASDEATRHRIASTNEDNGEGPGRLLGNHGDACACGGHYDINLERNQLGCEGGESLGILLRISVFNYEVATLNVPEVTHSLKESLACGRVTGQIVAAHEAGLCLATQSAPAADFTLRPRRSPSGDRGRRRRASQRPVAEGGRYPPPSRKRPIASSTSAPAGSRPPSPAHPWRHSTPYSTPHRGMTFSRNS